MLIHDGQREMVRIFQSSSPPCPKLCCSLTVDSWPNFQSPTEAACPLGPKIRLKNYKGPRADLPSEPLRPERDWVGPNVFRQFEAFLPRPSRPTFVSPRLAFRSPALGEDRNCTVSVPAVPPIRIYKYLLVFPL